MWCNWFLAAQIFEGNESAAKKTQILVQISYSQTKRWFLEARQKKKNSFIARKTDYFEFILLAASISLPLMGLSFIIVWYIAIFVSFLFVFFLTFLVSFSYIYIFSPVIRTDPQKKKHFMRNAEHCGKRRPISTTSRSLSHLLAQLLPLRLNRYLSSSCTQSYCVLFKGKKWGDKDNDKGKH